MATVMSVADSRKPPIVETKPSKSGFIIGPVADSVLIIGAPVVGLLIAAPLFAIPTSYFEVPFRGKPLDLRQTFIATFINAHLFLVYFRTHANQNIFRMYPMRFIAVPLLMFAVGAFSPPVLGIMGWIAIWWDVYHSSLQTFGFGRIYDSKQNNDANMGRNLDYWMNLLVYAGPVLAGAHFVDHVTTSLYTLERQAVEKNSLSELFLRQTPDFLVKNQSYMTVVILAIGIPFGLYYLSAYYRLQQQGYRVSWQKVWLYLITTVVSIYSWGFRSFIDAFWVMNFFHALQYFAIVSFVEHKNLTQLFRLNQYARGWILAIFWVVSFSCVYGFWSRYLVGSSWSWSLVVTTSIMHFWYDSFIWSVKKKQV